ncbi:unnamed protein product [Lactuca virosa]|uniref:Uncharacterized protein n=1 Tax=Lactuca virosa TaxID=75947 RepID=A0AAU9NRS9_9ASTR|nr:unnamed protein product [Lactuca virosa]
MANTGLWTIASPPEEQLVPNTTDPEDTIAPAVLAALTLMVFKEVPIEDEVNGAASSDSAKPTEEGYTPIELEHISSNYDLEEDTTTLV